MENSQASNQIGYPFWQKTLQSFFSSHSRSQVLPDWTVPKGERRYRAYGGKPCEQNWYNWIHIIKWYLYNKPVYLGPGSPSEITKLWDALRCIAEPSGLIGDTIMCVAKEQTDQKTATEVQQRLVARSDSSSSSRSCSSGSFAVEHLEPRDSQGSNTQLYTPNPTRYESCCFLTECRRNTQYR